MCLAGQVDPAAANAKPTRRPSLSGRTARSSRVIAVAFGVAVIGLSMSACGGASTKADPDEFCRSLQDLNQARGAGASGRSDAEWKRQVDWFSGLGVPANASKRVRKGYELFTDTLKDVEPGYYMPDADGTYSGSDQDAYHAFFAYEHTECPKNTPDWSAHGEGGASTSSGDVSDDPDVSASPTPSPGFADPTAEGLCAEARPDVATRIWAPVLTGQAFTLDTDEDSGSSLTQRGGVEYDDCVLNAPAGSFDQGATDDVGSLYFTRWRLSDLDDVGEDSNKCDITGRDTATVFASIVECAPALQTSLIDASIVHAGAGGIVTDGQLKFWAVGKGHLYEGGISGVAGSPDYNPYLIAFAKQLLEVEPS